MRHPHHRKDVIVTQDDFENTIKRLSFEQTRSQLYKMGLRMIDSDFEIEAYILILATWNFAGFRYVLRKFDLDQFRETIAAVNPVFSRLATHSFESADFDLLASDITTIYSQLRPLVLQTGTSKIMHFKNPKLFVMWDTAIRSYYRVPNVGSAQHYLDFLRLMRDTFGHLRWAHKDRGFAKSIDEYNLAIAHPATNDA